MWRVVTPERVVYWVPRLFLGIGILLLVLTPVMVVRTAQFLAGAERTDGTVVDLSRSKDSEGSVTFSPVVSFTTAEGRTVEFVSSSGSSSPSHSEGDRVEVLYDPDDPNDARLSGFLDLWFGSLVVGVLGAAFTVFSAVVLWHMRKPRQTDVELLRSQGQRVQGTSPRAVYCDEVDVKGRSPFRVEVDVHEPAHNQVRVLASEYVLFDPAPYLKDRDTVNVYLDRKDRERYLVDISFLPRLAD